MNRSNIKEANEHLQKLYQRVQDLESTVQEQAEAMIRKDEEAEKALRELGRSKDREIAELRKSLESSEVHVQQLMASCRDKDAQILTLKQRSRILEEVCQELPSLEIVVGALRKTVPLLRSRHASGLGHDVTNSSEGGPVSALEDRDRDHVAGKLGEFQINSAANMQNNIPRNFSISDDDEGNLA
ncbi:vimentin-type intermediate filament-associated coiled-coil protein-like [Acanthaster planci]|uniref:Vimentin-type intermediate filament-associated coiled-coil protein-like n=1 Tax=Acanthaster planci TaxID=133434 RepID=A0A8B7Y628_ACAPL|nr:vimentin-type intermediate filament-associated coiled-coil protein-like [Acanthaster planci]